MKKFKVEIVQNSYRKGTYELEAPDVDAAFVLAQDIQFGNPMITWEPFNIGMANWPAPHNIFVEDADEAHS